MNQRAPRAIRMHTPGWNPTAVEPGMAEWLAKFREEASAEARLCRRAQAFKQRQGFGSDEQLCEFCHDEPAHFDSVLGWVGPECEKKITEGDDEPEPSDQP